MTDEYPNPDDFNVRRTVVFNYGVAIADQTVHNVEIDDGLAVENYGVQFLASDVVDLELADGVNPMTIGVTVPWSGVAYIISTAVPKTSEGDDNEG